MRVKNWIMLSVLCSAGIGLSGCRNMDYTQMPLYDDVYPVVYPDLRAPKRLPRSQPYTTQRGMPPTPQARIMPPPSPPRPQMVMGDEATDQQPPFMP